MRFSGFVLPLAMLLSAGTAGAQVTLPTGTTRFSIVQGEKTVGSTECTVTSTGSGYTVTSQGELRLSKLTYSFNDTQMTDRALNLVSGQITGSVNGKPVTFAVKADPTGRQFNITVTAEGKSTQNTVDRHQHLALLPDLDAAGYTLLHRVGLENPQISWVLIPKQNGLLVPTTYTRGANVRGRFEGREIDVQHTTVTVSAQNSITVELFYAQDGRLLEADLPEQNFYVIRDGFRLANRPKFAPPRSPEQNPGQGPGPNARPQYSTPQGQQRQMQQQ